MNDECVFCAYFGEYYGLIVRAPDSMYVVGCPWFIDDRDI